MGVRHLKEISKERKKFRKAFANKFSNLFPIFIIEMANLFIYLN